MRYLTTALAAFLSLASIAQTPYGREQVVEVDTITSAEVLKAKARQWFVDTFKDANEVIQMDDAATNTIVGKGWSEFGPNAGIHYTIEVACKQGRARYRIYDVHHKGRGSINLGAGPVPVPSWGALYDEEQCYTPVRAGMQSAAGAEKQMKKQCVANRPEIDKRLDRIAALLEAALKSASTPAANDW
jgi:hypothetical protein